MRYAKECIFASGLIAFFGTSFLAGSANACTAVSAAQGGPIAVAKTFDWPMGHGMLALNKRGMSKQALILGNADAPAKWTSKYASLSFNQVGLEFPLEGMNEKGLSIDILWLDGSQYPAADSRQTVDEVQWIQYQLDTASSLDEVAQSDSKIRISPAFAQVHYFVCDRSGACGVFEYLDGALVLHRGPDLKIPVLTNDTYAESLSWLPQFEGFGGSEAIPQGSDSESRFVRAAAWLEKPIPAAATDRINAIFGLLASVAAPSTQWSMLFLPQSGEVQFQTNANPARHLVGFSGFNLSCSQTTQVYDLSSRTSGAIDADFVAYTKTFNTQLADESVYLPVNYRGLIAAYPEQNTRCATP